MGKIFQYIFWEKLMFGCHGKIFFPMAPGHQFLPKFEKDENDKNSSARSENVMVKPKNSMMGRH